MFRNNNAIIAHSVYNKSGVIIDILKNNNSYKTFPFLVCCCLLYFLVYTKIHTYEL